MNLSGTFYHEALFPWLATRNQSLLLEKRLLGKVRALWRSVFDELDSSFGMQNIVPNKKVPALIRKVVQRTHRTMRAAAR
jgi:hypothetical protein